MDLHVLSIPDQLTRKALAVRDNTTSLSHIPQPLGNPWINHYLLQERNDVNGAISII